MKTPTSRRSKAGQAPSAVPAIFDISKLPEPGLQLLNTVMPSKWIPTAILQRQQIDSLIERAARQSKVWRAIDDHISRDGDCVLIERLAAVPGSSAASGVRFRRSRINFEQQHITVDFVVGYYDRDDDREFDRDYTLLVPIELFTDYSLARFNAWVGELRDKRDTAKTNAELVQLEALINKHPDAAKKLLK